MKTKLILIAIAIITTLSSCDNDGSKYANKHKNDFYWNEDFTLVDRKENTTVQDHNPAIIRTWVIQRNTATNDSIELAVINTVFENGDDPMKNCGCTTNKFRLTTELWYGKKIGETLHFKYLRKNRFFKKLKSQGEQFGEQPKELITKTVSSGAVTTTTVVEQPNDTDQNKILELEKQKMSIEAELNKLKIK